MIDERKMIYLQVQIISFENRGVEVVKYMKFLYNLAIQKWYNLEIFSKQELLWKMKIDIICSIKLLRYTFQTEN